MRQALYQRSTKVVSHYLIAVIGVFTAVALSLLPMDNVFWYKSATLLYALSCIMYLSYPLFINKFFKVYTAHVLPPLKFKSQAGYGKAN